MKNTAWRSTCIVGFVLEKRKIAMDSSFPRMISSFSPNHALDCPICPRLGDKRVGR